MLIEIYLIFFTPYISESSFLLSFSTCSNIQSATAGHKLTICVILRCFITVESCECSESPKYNLFNIIAFGYSSATIFVSFSSFFSLLSLLSFLLFPCISILPLLSCLNSHKNGNLAANSSNSSFKQ